MADKKPTETPIEPTKEMLKRELERERAVTKAALIKGVTVTHTKGFFDFVRKQGVVGLAVGLAIGTSAGAAVKSIVDNLINPIVGFLIGGLDLAKLKWVIIPANGARGGLIIGWGPILSAIITLLATAFVIYQLVHVAKLDRIDKPKDS